MLAPAPTCRTEIGRARLVFLAALLLAALSLGTGCSRLNPRPGTTVVATSQQAPDFSLVAHTGQTVRLQDLLGKGPVVLAFYRGHW